MSIYGKILFEHQSFQDLMTKENSSETRNSLANKLLNDGPLKDKFSAINNKLGTKVDKVEGARLITQAEADKLADLENYNDEQIKNDINNINNNLSNNYEIKGSAQQALIDAKAYADGLAGNYDSKGSAASAQSAAISVAAADATTKAENALKAAKQFTTTKIDEVSQLNKNYTNQKVEQLDAKTQVRVNGIESSINQEAKTRADEDNKLSQQIKEVSDLADETNTSLNNLLKDAGELEDVKDFLDSLADQLGDNSIAILLTRIEQLEKILYSENLIIGEVDNSTFSPISPTN